MLCLKDFSSLQDVKCDFSIFKSDRNCLFISIRQSLLNLFNLFKHIVTKKRDI